MQPWSEALPGIHADWQRLVAERGFNPTLGPDWVEATAKSLGTPGVLSVYTVSRDGSLAGVIPYFLNRSRFLGVPLRVLQLACNLMSYHPEVVTCLPPRDLIQRFLASVPRWDVFHAAGLPVDGETAAALRGIADSGGAILQAWPSDESPYLSIDSTWDNYLSRKSKKFRYKVRQAELLVATGGPYALRWFYDPSEADALLDDILVIESRSWKAQFGLDIPSRPSELAYHRAVLPYLAQSGQLIANVLYSDARPIAYSLCCMSGRWMGQLKTSFDLDFKDSSPGNVVIQASIRRAFESGAIEFDFLGHTDSHKRFWTAQTRTHSDYFLFAPRPVTNLIGRTKLLKERFFGNDYKPPVRPSAP